jgi:hypothetical protein
MWKCRGRGLDRRDGVTAGGVRRIWLSGARVAREEYATSGGSGLVLEVSSRSSGHLLALGQLGRGDASSSAHAHQPWPRTTKTARRLHLCKRMMFCKVQLEHANSAFDGFRTSLPCDEAALHSSVVVAAKPQRSGQPYTPSGISGKGE